MRTKEEMAAYQRERRMRLKGLAVAEDSGFPVIGGPCANCVVLMEQIERLKSEVVELRRSQPVIKTKVDAVRAVKTLPVSSGRATHSPTCGCLMCKPPKG